MRNAAGHRSPTVHDRVALVHDQLVQRGGAERVVLLMADAFPGAPIYTSLYDQARTFPEFASLDVRTSPLDRVAWFRGHVRAALPLMPSAFSWLRPSAQVTLCSSTGWSHGVRASGRKVVYCHAPARWLYQTTRYLGAPATWQSVAVSNPSGALGALGALGAPGVAGGDAEAPSGPGRPVTRLVGGTEAARSSSRWSPPSAARMAMWALGRPLRRWDQRAARTADRYLANSTATAAAIRAVYGLDAEVLPPPPAVVPGGVESAVAGVDPGFWLCVSRLLPYKNVDAVVEAVERRPGDRLVVVGDGPERAFLEGRTGPRVRFLGAVVDEELRWLYRNCRGLVSASYEDFGLTPLEAASFGRPSTVLRWGGFLDTLRDGETGVFFDEPVPEDIMAAMDRLTALDIQADVLAAHAARFDHDRFIARLRQVVDEEISRAG